MLDYRAPEDDCTFLLNDLFATERLWDDIPAFADFTPDLIAAVIGEAGKLASGIMAPLNQSGDAEGCRWEQGVVTAPTGFREAYEALAGGGWLGLSGNPEFGGQGMPKMVGCLVEEMFWGANTSLYLYGTLTVGAAICLDAHGSPEQKARYLPRLYAGEWSGAMDLTEPHAGSDLGIIRTRAVANGDGSFAISGTKMFITSGEHDLTDNIVHLVLARTPDAPAGSRGISLFIVPKFLPDAAGEPGVRNAVASGSIEHKMGIHGSATNVMNYDGATGWLVGEEYQGLACMFTMMNYERLSVGLQGLGAGELAYQQAVAYARDRLQGRAPAGPTNPQGVADPLLVHPDVRRMLLTIRAYTEAGRAFAVYVGSRLDRARYADDADAARLSELLTPVAKAFMTDRGFECAVLAQQVFGGHGFIREWGVEQIVRDTRISQIYEGTNGIQALDLIARKVLRDGADTLFAFVDTMRATDVGESWQALLHEALDRLVRITYALLERAPAEPALPGAIATDYLELLGHAIYAWLWARMATVAGDDEFGEAKRVTAAFYYTRLLPRMAGLEQSVLASCEPVTAFPDSAF
jgi:alkylation response protein AidB-like acyl-CoA dehydrogenase